MIVSMNVFKLVRALARKAGASAMVAMIAASGLAMSAGISPAVAQRGAGAVSIDFGGESEVSKSIVLPLNKAAIVELPHAAADVLVSQPSVVDAVVRSPKRVYLLGLRTGQTNAFFFDSRGRQILNLEIRVERDMDALTELLGRLLPDARINVESINDTVILRGMVPNSTDAATAAEIAAHFINDEDKIIPMLSVREREQVMLKVRIVEMQRNVIKQLGIDTGSMVTLSNTALDTAASTLAGGQTGGLLGTATRLFGSANQNNVSLSFQALERVGLVRTLAEPNLTAVSGESANFLAGGEFPVPVGQDDGVITIEFKQFGVGLGFTPIVIDKGLINVKVSTEVSEITSLNNFGIGGQTITIPGNPAVPAPPDQFELSDLDGDGLSDVAQNITDLLATGGNSSGSSVVGALQQRQGEIPATEPTVVSAQGLNIPALSVRRANTTVEIPSGGSLVLAGLLQQNMRQTVNGIPGLKDIAIIGQLFRSRDYLNSESELVIVVTPYIVESTSKDKLTDPSEGFVPASDAQAILLGKITSSYGLSSRGVQSGTLQGPMGFILD